MELSKRFQNDSISNSEIHTTDAGGTANNEKHLKGYCTVFQHAYKSLEITGIVLP